MLTSSAKPRYVFPVKPWAKEPLGGHGHIDATVYPDQIRTWWTATPDANIGLHLAKSGLVALDAPAAIAEIAVKAGPGMEAAHKLFLESRPAMFEHAVNVAGLFPAGVKPFRRGETVDSVAAGFLPPDWDALAAKAGETLDPAIWASRKSVTSEGESRFLCRKYSRNVTYSAVEIWRGAPAGIVESTPVSRAVGKPRQARGLALYRGRARQTSTITQTCEAGK